MKKVVISLKKLSCSAVLLAGVSSALSLPAIAANSVVSSASATSSQQPAEANSAKNALINKLEQVNFFSANFSQTVYDEQNNLLQSATGQLSIAKPNLVNFHTKSPEETVIVSDGTTLWFFDPFIEQVTAHTLAAAIANTPILLLTSNDKSQWDSYDISEQAITDKAGVDAAFLIESKDQNSQVKSLAVKFNGAKIVGFDISDATGQVSHVELSAINTTAKPSDETFTFTVPEGIYLDDQR